MKFKSDTKTQRHEEEPAEHSTFAVGQESLPYYGTSAVVVGHAAKIHHERLRDTNTII